MPPLEVLETARNYLIASRDKSSRTHYKVRALCQATLFTTLLVGTLLVNVLTNNNNTSTTSFLRTQPSTESAAVHDSWNRELQVSCSSIPKADPAWMCVFYAIGVLYMFLALAIVCDEFFVPALEEMSGPRRLNLSMDVAGATLMAAGGSAPELFSSLFGTFTESEIGFGTIIGSAVFNVLFVIAMCSLFAKEVLTLTWWPLFRDSLCYAIGLAVLSIFVGVTTPEKIVLWEACVLFALYLIYILIMWQNANIYRKLTGKELEYPEDSDEEDTDKVVMATTKTTEEPTQDDAAEKNTNESGDSGATSGTNGTNESDTVDPEQAGEGVPEESRPQSETPSECGSVNSNVSYIGALNAARAMEHQNYDFRWQGTFRAGILTLLRHPQNWVHLGGVGIVAKIAGDANQVFKEIDENGDGSVDKDELRKLFERLDCNLSESQLDEVFNELDTNGDGVISFDEFNSWYTRSAELIRSQVRQIFDQLDKDNSGTLDKLEVKALLVELDPTVTDEDVEAAIDAMYKEGSREEITFDEFEAWYEHSIIYERQLHAVEEDMEGVFENLKPPMGEGIWAWTQYIFVLPLVLVMVFTIPDVRRPGWGRWCYFAFIMSIAWIGLFSWLMVTWAEIIGNTIGIPSVIMGYTVLAAGTSVPDLLSSVIVARRGHGDMAVSSSIGSNIFDILVGLPIPWILYTAWPTTGSFIAINSKGIWTSIFVLLGMLVFVVVAIHCQGWKLTKTLGGLMMLFYVGFLVQAIVLELPFEVCTP